jgi:glycosyltransferase involved in cell wall biosynthesis
VAGSAEALQMRGLDVTVLSTLCPGDEDVVKAVWEPMLARGVELKFCTAPQAKDLLLDREPVPAIRDLVDSADIVHLHGLWSPPLVLVARYARKQGKPYFVSTHGVLDHRAMHRTWPKWVKKRLTVEVLRLRGVLRDAHAVIFGSEAEARESWDIAPGMKRIYIPNGVDAGVARTAVSPEARDRIARIAPQFATWKRSLLFFSRIHPEKGLDMLVKAFNDVAAEFPDTGLLIAGLRQDERYQREVEGLISDGGHADRIVLTTELTGPKSQFLHSLCDIFVLPSHAEGFSVALIEALAHGMPCLITQFCHFPAVEDAGAGFVVEPSPAGVELGLRKLLSLSEGELAAMMVRARALFVARFTWSKVAEQLEAAYASACSERTQKAA